MTLVSVGNATPRERADANAAVAKALRDGILTQQPCSDCGREPAVAHHEDYARPLDVVWLCRVHHVAAHTPAPDDPRTQSQIIGRRVKKLRMGDGLSQTDLAVKLGVSWVTVSRLERGVGKGITVDRLHDVADALDVSVDELLRGAA